MAVPVAPAAGEPIAEAWGDVVHDAVVAQDIQTGFIDITLASGSTGKTARITFGRPFASAPVVMLTRDDSASSALMTMVSNGSITAVDCICKVYPAPPSSTIAGTTRVYWLAYGPRA
jgi:hypothetical protein